MWPIAPRRRASFRRNLLRWYGENARKLPWRGACDPYAIWVSEVMLQQTRVTAVLEHYERFLKRFPTIEKLAAARLESVLAAWSGLGYYRRARMMHAAARVMVKQHGGQLPADAAALRALPGIGRYSAAAIGSIAFGRAEAVVDGNVERVLRRVSGDPRLRGEALWQAANALLDPGRPADFNQAMMELGATVCLPKSPQCSACPVRPACVTRGEHAKGAVVRQKKKEVAYLYTRRNGSVLLKQRPPDSTLMAGMWELPECAADGEPLLRVRHSITTTDYAVSIYSRNGENMSGEWIVLGKVRKLPLTGLTRKVLRRLAVL